MSIEYLYLLCMSNFLIFSAGFFIGLVWCSFRLDERNSTKRLPRYGKHPDMKVNGSNKKQ